MKIARMVLKVVACSLALAAAACCVIAYWDKLTEAVQKLGAKLGCQCRKTMPEYDDYADWDE